jgi:hypothetical protein
MMEDIFAKYKRKWTDEEIDRADDLASRMMASKDWEGDWAKAFAISRSMLNKGFDVRVKPSKPHKKYIHKKKKKKAAETFELLTIVANALDNFGMVKEADIIDGMLRNFDNFEEDSMMEDSNMIHEAAKKKEKWIPKDMKDGRFTEYCKRNGYEGPCAACANEAMKSDDASVRGMASFYLNRAVKSKKKKAEVAGLLVKIANDLDDCDMSEDASIIDGIFDKINTFNSDGV